MKRYPPLVSLLSPSFVSFSTAAAITITRFTISPPSPVLVSATLRFSNSRRTLEILSRRRRSIGRKEPEIVTQMNLKYCHFTFPPVPLSLSLSPPPRSFFNFPLSYLSFRHRSFTIFSINDHLLPISLSNQTRILSLAPSFVSRSLSFYQIPYLRPFYQPNQVYPLLAHFSSVLAHHFTPTLPPNVSPTFSSLVFAASYRCATPPPSRCTPSCRLPSPTIDAPGRICKFSG